MILKERKCTRCGNTDFTCNNFDVYDDILIYFCRCNECDTLLEVKYKTEFFEIEGHS